MLLEGSRFGPAQAPKNDIFSKHKDSFLGKEQEQNDGSCHVKFDTLIRLKVIFLLKLSGVGEKGSFLKITLHNLKLQSEELDYIWYGSH